MPGALRARLCAERRFCARLTELHHAALKGHADATCALIAAGADVGIKDADGYARSRALAGGRRTTVRLSWQCAARRPRTMQRRAARPRRTPMPSDGCGPQASPPVVREQSAAGREPAGAGAAHPS